MADVARYADSVTALGAENFEKLRACKILVVGAGGIGCELLKNLVLVGAESLVVVDLDTIDVSNLNRQFLFRRKHVGKSKADVAGEVVKRFNPRCSVQAIHANIKEERFNMSWFGAFDVVINALDNVDARRHVNRMCLATDTPLVEAGTTGFLGQVFVIRKGETACYECFPKPTRVVYPICTIRSTPSQPVHCVVWAKELFKLLFGDAPESMLHEAEEVDASTFARPCAAVREAAADAADEVTGAALAALCDAEIRKQLAMDKYKTAKKVPAPLDGAAVRGACRAAAAPSVKADRPADWDRALWTSDECCAELAAVTRELLAPDLRSRLGSWAFDKDEPAAMRFVTAAANLRCRIFHIPPASLYECKGIAGNIIPAIATTNAVVAGLQVLELLKLIEHRCILGPKDGPRGRVDEACRYTYCLRESTRKGLLLQPTRLEEPQKVCYVCRAGKVTVALDTTKFTLGAFVDAVLKRKLGFVKPAVEKGFNGLVDEEDERLAANLGKSLAEQPAGGVGDGVLLTVTDFSTDLELSVAIKHRPEADFDEKKHPELYEVLQGAAAEDVGAMETDMLAAPAPAADGDENAAPAEASSEPPAKKARA